MRADARANQEAVIQAAVRLIPREGAQVPLTTVAEEAGVGIATLYRNFPTRESLLLAVIQSVAAQAKEILESALGGLRADPQECWPRLVRDLAGLRLGALLPELGSTLLTTELRTEAIALRTRLLAIEEEALAIVRDAGLVPADLTPMRFQLGLGIATRPLPMADMPELVDQTDWMVEVFIKGLRP